MEFTDVKIEHPSIKFSIPVARVFKDFDERRFFLKTLLGLIGVENSATLTEVIHDDGLEIWVISK